MARNRSEKELEAAVRPRVYWSTAASTDGTFTISTGTPSRARTQMRPVTKAMPSAWMWDCPNCDSIKLVATMATATCLACRTAAPMLSLRYGAVWGHEWAAVVHMRKAQIEYDQLDDEFGRYADVYPTDYHT